MPRRGDRHDRATPKTHVVVVGGGYAGTLAANHLRQRPDIDITVVNPRPVFVERIRLHQVVADTGTATVDYDSLLGDGIRLVVDGADRIDTADRRRAPGSGAELDYDYLIYAVGSTGRQQVSACPARPNSPIPSPIWKARCACGTRWLTCRRTLPSRWWAAD